MTWKIDKVIFSIVNLYWLVWVTTLYKQKADKMQSVNQFNNDEKMLKSSNKWWKKIIIKKNMIKIKSIQHEFNMLIILKFLNIEKKSHLTLEQIKKLITDNLQLKKKKLFL